MNWSNITFKEAQVRELACLHTIAKSAIVRADDSETGDIVPLAVQRPPATLYLSRRLRGRSTEGLLISAIGERGSPNSDPTNSFAGH
jgi:hypothetical protein